MNRTTAVTEEIDLSRVITGASSYLLSSLPKSFLRFFNSHYQFIHHRYYHHHFIYSFCKKASKMDR